MNTDPFSQKALPSYPYDNADSVHEKIGLLQSAFQKWRFIPVSERVSAVRTALSYFDQNRDTIAREITRQMGKPITQSYQEISGFFERANYLCQIAEKTLAPEILPAKKFLTRRIEHVPLGIVFVLSAWNYPLLISGNSIIPALLAGNTLLLKHSRLTPSIGKHFEKAFRKMSGINNLLRHTATTHSISQNIIAKSGVAHIVFTGSEKGGVAIQRSVKARFVDCQLELGGKDAGYVAADADNDKAAEIIVDGAMYNAGQSCCGIERVYVHKKIFPSFLKRCVAFAKKYRLGDPMDTKTTMGPLAIPGATKAIQKQIANAIAEGAKIVLGGKVLKIGNGIFLEPTILSNVANHTSLIQEENFAPILPIVPVSSMKQAIGLINDSRYGLTAAIFTSEEKTANEFAEKVETGTVFMNRCDYLDPALPWTGIKMSGKGSALSKYGFHALTRKKSINFRTQL